jgi:hypothetical protein
MRPQQQNRRMRGRNNNNNPNRGKGGPNPLTRSYESNGPDVKIRGNAQQIAEKYATLARDAQSSGDRVMAENYLQHAEHYNRIIAAAQAQMPIQNFQQNRDDFDDEDGEDRDDMDFQGNSGGEQPAQNGNGPQPVIEGMPAEVALNGETGGEGQNRHRDSFRNRDGRDRDGRNRDRNRDFQNRNGNGDYQRRDFNRRDDQRNEGQRNEGQHSEGQRNEGQRNEGQRGHEQRADDQQRRDNQSFAGRPVNEQPLPAAQPQVAQVEDVADDSLPAFLTGGNAEPAAAAAPAEAPRKPRRPRKPREAAEASGSEAEAAPEASSGEALAPVEG